jgi:uncharacterized protein DUF5615
VRALQQEPGLKGLEDHAVLALAADEGRVLITRNSRDFAPLLVARARGGELHAGCILIWSLDHADHTQIVGEVERLLHQYPRPEDWSGITGAI